MNQTQAGRNYFDEEAYTWDEKPSRIRIAKKLGEAIAEKVPLHNSMDVMDFGCGTGLVSLVIHPHVGSLRGVDSSRGMLDVFEEKIRGLGLKNCSLELLDLEHQPLPEAAYDLIFSTMTFHHLPDPRQVVEQFYRALRPGGFLSVVDLDTEEGDFHDKGNEGVAHPGFDRSYIRRIFEETGFDSVDLDTAYVIRKEKTGKEFPLFIATGKKRE